MRFLDTSRIRSKCDEGVIASDGARLSVDVYLPATPGRYPVLVTRTPYDNNRFTSFPLVLPAVLTSPVDRFKKLAALGFIVVACDVRGRGDSDGAFVPFVDEVRDGETVLEWARALPESNGRAGVFGSGYAGYAALIAATNLAVDAVAVSSPLDPADAPFSGGVLRLDWLFWMHLVGGRTLQTVDVPRWDKVFRHRPLVSMNEALGRDDIPWSEWLRDGPSFPAVELERLSAPTLFVSGWWDNTVGSTVRSWQAASRLQAGAGHALLVGPWDVESVRHPRADVGGVDWGPSALVDPDQLLSDWFGAHLKGEGEPSRSARLFLTGRNTWISLTDPEPATETKTLWLSSSGRANTRRGDGKLVPAPARDTPPDRFTHNPADPVPWQPAYGSFSRRAEAKITLDTRFATGRDDVLVYDSEPAQEPLLILGSCVAQLWVESTAHDADWLAAIEDVFPGNGRSVHLAHAIVRAGSLEPRQADGPIELALELSPVAHHLLPGHVLRLVVASSLFPLYAVNLGGPDYLRGTEPHLSEHSVFHETTFPSVLEVPVADADAIAECS